MIASVFWVFSWRYNRVECIIGDVVMIKRSELEVVYKYWKEVVREWTLEEPHSRVQSDSWFLSNAKKSLSCKSKKEEEDEHFWSHGGEHTHMHILSTWRSLRGHLRPSTGVQCFVGGPEGTVTLRGCSEQTLAVLLPNAPTKQHSFHAPCDSAVLKLGKLGFLHNYANGPDGCMMGAFLWYPRARCGGRVLPALQNWPTQTDTRFEVRARTNALDPV